MTRVTSGSAKGKKLNTPDIPEYRAVQDKAKLAIFSILGETVQNAECLDLYSGSGNLGIEVLSRGAKHCDFVDENRAAELAITKNLQNTNLQEKAEVFRHDAVKYATDAHKTYDIIFVDPFYKDTAFKFLFQNLEEILAPTGIIFFSHGKNTDVKNTLTNSPNLKIDDEKRYGNAYITVIKKALTSTR